MVDFSWIDFPWRKPDYSQEVALMETSNGCHLHRHPVRYYFVDVF